MLQNQGISHQHFLLRTFRKMCELSVPHQEMSTQARQAQGIQKTEIKDINATTL